MNYTSIKILKRLEKLEMGMGILNKLKAQVNHSHCNEKQLHMLYQQSHCWCGFLMEKMDSCQEMETRGIFSQFSEKSKE